MTKSLREEIKSLRILVQLTHNRIAAPCYVELTKQNLGDPDDRRISRPAIPWQTAVKSEQKARAVDLLIYSVLRRTNPRREHLLGKWLRSLTTQVRNPAPSS